MSCNSRSTVQVRAVAVTVGAVTPAVQVGALAVVVGAVTGAVQVGAIAVAVGAVTAAVEELAAGAVTVAGRIWSSSC